jgi:activator of HSP90 ATPase
VGQKGILRVPAGSDVMPCKDTNRRNSARLGRHPEALEGLASKASSASASSSPKTSPFLSASAVNRAIVSAVVNTHRIHNAHSMNIRCPSRRGAAEP